MATGCPCGAHVKPGVEDVLEFTADLAETVVGDAGKFFDARD